MFVIVLKHARAGELFCTKSPDPDLTTTKSCGSKIQKLIQKNKMAEKGDLKSVDSEDLSTQIKFMANRIKALESIINDLVNTFKNENNEKTKSIEIRLTKIESCVEQFDKESNESAQHEIKSMNCKECNFKCNMISSLRKHIKKEHRKSSPKNCHLCEKIFSESYQPETHLKEHSEAETYDCDQCWKSFAFKWRHRKHIEGHKTKNYCHFFNNGKNCLYEEVGCKFNHERSPHCKYGTSCNNNLCQFRHEDNLEENPTITLKENTSTKQISIEKCSDLCVNTLEKYKQIHQKEEETNLKTILDKSKALEEALAEIESFKKNKESTDKKLKLFSATIHKLHNDSKRK